MVPTVPAASLVPLDSMPDHDLVQVEERCLLFPPLLYNLICNVY